jgi:hypothetical protein
VPKESTSPFERERPRGASYETCFEEARPESWFVAASLYVDWRSEELPSILLAGSPEFTGLTDLFRGSLGQMISGC